MARIEPSELIQALEERGPAVVVTGLLSEGVEGRVRIFRGMDVREYYEVDGDDIIHVLDHEDPNTPARVLVAEDAEIVHVSRFKARMLRHPTFASHICNSDQDCCLQFGDDMYRECLRQGLNRSYCRALGDYYAEVCEHPNAFPPPAPPLAPPTPR